MTNDEKTYEAGCKDGYRECFRIVDDACKLLKRIVKAHRRPAWAEGETIEEVMDSVDDFIWSHRTGHKIMKGKKR